MERMQDRNSRIELNLEKETSRDVWLVIIYYIMGTICYICQVDIQILPPGVVRK